MERYEAEMERYEAEMERYEAEMERYEASVQNGYCMYDYCMFPFDYVTARNHMTKMHSYYECDFCYRSFYLEKSRKDHMNATQHGYACRFCDEMFPTKYDLNEHLKGHRSRNGFHQSSASAYLNLPTDTNPVTFTGYFPNVLNGMRESESLANFIERVIRPKNGYNTSCEDLVNKLKKFLENNTGLRVNRVVIGGSMGKLTNIPKYSDVDLVVFIDDYHTMVQFTNNLDSVLEDLERHLLNDLTCAKTVEHIRTTHHAVQFKANLKMHDTPGLRNIDLLPAFDLSNLELKEIYKEMKTKTEKERDYYSVCFVEEQTNFVKSIPPEVRDFIRLVKHWKMTEDVPVKSYFLELLVIHMWKDVWKEPKQLNVYSMFREVISALKNIHTMEITWPDMYKSQKYCPLPEKPVLLDPVNPYNNIAPSDDEDLNRIVKKSKSLLKRMLKKQQFNNKNNSAGHLPSMPESTTIDIPFEESNRNRCCWCVII